MSIKPSQYKILQPFEAWVQQTLPAIYDDSLSYTDLLAKMLAYLNNLVENNNALSTDMKNAIDYINNYFDNLDVQDEINKKLDKMAEDGTLSRLIQPLFDEYKTEINAIVAEQNNKINQLSAFVTPEMFGAVGDGVTDDTEAIQNAINNQGRVPVIFKNKKYCCNGTLLLKYGTQLVGCGERVNPTILYYTGTGVFITQNSPETNGSSSYTDCSDVSIKNLRLEGTGRDGTTALYLVHGSNIRTDNVRIVEFDNGVFIGSQRIENDKYVLMSIFNFDVICQKPCRIWNVQDTAFVDCVFNGINKTKTTYCLEISPLVNGQKVAEPLAISFYSCILQGGKNGVMLGGGYDINFFGGHSEFLEKLIVANKNSDGANFYGFTNIDLENLGDWNYTIGVNYVHNPVTIRDLIHDTNGVSKHIGANSFTRIAEFNVDLSLTTYHQYRIVVHFGSNIANATRFFQIKTNGLNEAVIIGPKIEYTETGEFLYDSGWKNFDNNKTYSTLKNMVLIAESNINDDIVIYTAEVMYRPMG